MRDYIASNKEYGETTLVLRGVVDVEKIAGTTALMFHKVDAQGNKYIGDILDINVWDIHSDDTQITNKYAYELDSDNDTNTENKNQEKFSMTKKENPVGAVMEALLETLEVGEVVAKKASK